MNIAKKIAMDEYGLTEWPQTHVRTPMSVDCRAYACVILQKEGLSLKEIAVEIGFSDSSNVGHAIRRFKSRNMPSIMSSVMRENKRIDELEQALLAVMDAVGYLTARDMDERKEPYYMRAVALLKGVK